MHGNIVCGNHTVLVDPVAAAALVDRLNRDEANEDGWAYKLKTFPTGNSVVEVYDEDGFYLGRL